MLKALKNGVAIGQWEQSYPSAMRSVHRGEVVPRGFSSISVHSSFSIRNKIFGIKGAAWLRRQFLYLSHVTASRSAAQPTPDHKRVHHLSLPNRPPSSLSTFSTARVVNSPYPRSAVPMKLGCYAGRIMDAPAPIAAPYVMGARQLGVARIDRRRERCLRYPHEQFPRCSRWR